MNNINQNKFNNCKTAIITGSSRGIGAEIAKILSKKINNIVINYKNHHKRAKQVVSLIKKESIVNKFLSKVIYVKADITKLNDIKNLVSKTKEKFNFCDFLILNASGGMEKNVSMDYAFKLNCYAQENLVINILPIMRKNGKVIFVTSHQAHFIDKFKTLKEYEQVALSKKAGEEKLISFIPELSKKNIKLIIISGDLIKDSVTAIMLKRIYKDIFEERINKAGKLYSSHEFAQKIVNLALKNDLSTGHIEYVGGEDYLKLI